MTDESFVRWPPDRWISPSALNNYQICPQKVRFQLEGRQTPPTYVPFFTKGRAAHVILAACATALRDGREMVPRGTVEERVRRQIPREPYTTTDAWLAEVRDVVDWVERGKRTLQGLVPMTVLNVETRLHRPWMVVPQTPPYTLMARPDLIVLRQDAQGQEMVQMIDYKTGAIRDELMPPVVLRFAAKTWLASLGIDVRATPIRFTYVWLAHGQEDNHELTAELCNHEWAEILPVVEALVRETDWAPRPSPLCNYCAYYQNHCTETIPYDDWREEAAAWRGTS